MQFLYEELMTVAAKVLGKATFSWLAIHFYVPDVQSRAAVLNESLYTSNHSVCQGPTQSSLEEINSCSWYANMTVSQLSYFINSEQPAFTDPLLQGSGLFARVFTLSSSSQGYSSKLRNSLTQEILSKCLLSC